MSDYELELKRALKQLKKLEPNSHVTYFPIEQQFCVWHTVTHKNIGEMGYPQLSVVLNAIELLKKKE